MSKKGENIYKRKDQRWEGRYKKGRKEDGTIQYGYLYGKSYASVKERLYSKKAEYQLLIVQNGESTVCYQAFCLQWLENRKLVLKKSTYATYLYKLRKYVFPYIGEIPLNELCCKTIQSLVTTWNKSLSLQPSTIHVTYQIMKKSLSDAYREDKIKVFPCKNILLPKKSRSRVCSLTQEQEKRVEVQAKELPLVKGLPVILALKTGLRIGEISALRWEDVDLNKRILTIKHTYQRIPYENGENKTELLLAPAKTTQSVRVIPFGNNLYKWLKKAKRKAVGPYVCSIASYPREPRLITYHFHQLLALCGMKGIHFHQLRHTFATRCMESQGNVTAISSLLGHASTQMTLDTYTDADIHSLKETILRKEQLKISA